MDHQGAFVGSRPIHTLGVERFSTGCTDTIEDRRSRKCNQGVGPDKHFLCLVSLTGFFARMISGIGNTIRSGTLDKLPELYQVLLSVLEKSPGLLSLKKDIDNLIKYIGRIRRPFLARSIELVKIVRELDAYSKKAENRATTDREVLREYVLFLDAVTTWWYSSVS